MVHSSFAPEMKAMLLERVTSLAEEPSPLRQAEVPLPEPSDGEIRIKVNVCGICHTEIDEIEGRTPPPRFPVIPGHQVVGTVDKLATGVDRFRLGDRLGVAWIWKACGKCQYCQSGRENLCAAFMATGRDVNGGYAEFMTVPAAYAFIIPTSLTDSSAAPLLCAGAIGYRSLRLTGMVDGGNLGLTGFGASAHLVLKMMPVLYPYSHTFVFARKPEERKFALELGASWAGDTSEVTPEKMDAIIDTTPVWKPVLEALKQLKAGGRLVINAIRKENVDISQWLELNYAEHLWQEKEMKSVANVTRQDVAEFLELAGRIPLIPEVQEYPLEQANIALQEIRQQKIRGAKVLRIR